MREKSQNVTQYCVTLCHRIYLVSRPLCAGELLHSKPSLDNIIKRLDTETCKSKCIIQLGLRDPRCEVHKPPGRTWYKFHTMTHKDRKGPEKHPGDIPLHNFCVRWMSNKACLTFWRRVFLQILAHPVFKMWVIQKPNKVALWNKWHFEETKWRLYSMFKIFSTDICWMNIKWGILRIILRPSYIWDARFLKVKYCIVFHLYNLQWTTHTGTELNIMTSRHGLFAL